MVTMGLEEARLFRSDREFLAQSRVSLVIPAYREERRLPGYFPQLVAALADLPAELIVVDDGSPPASFAVLQRELLPHLGPGRRLLRYEPNRGKGAAVAYGLERAAGEFFGFVDADGSVPASEVRRVVCRCLANPHCDMVAGSRIRMLGRSIERSAFRHLAGRIFATALCRGFRIPVYDSQCGLKIFRRDRYLEVAGEVTDRRWVWDTELVILFHRRGWCVEEFPVDWHDVPGSKVRVVPDGLRMLGGLLRFHRLHP